MFINICRAAGSKPVIQGLDPSGMKVCSAVCLVACLIVGAATANQSFTNSDGRRPAVADSPHYSKPSKDH
jgi:hypothetical protein